MRLREDKIFSVIALPCLFYFVLLYRALLCPALLSIVLHDLVACFVCVWDLWVRPSGLWECSFTYVFWFMRFMSLLFGAVVRSICIITRDFPFNWIVFASMSYNLRASHSPIVLKIRGGVEDTRLEAKAKDTKKIRGQGQPFRGQTLSRPRTGVFEAKAKDQGHKRKCSPKIKKIFQAISTKKRFPKNFSSVPRNFNYSKSSAVLEQRTGQFSRI